MRKPPLDDSANVSVDDISPSQIARLLGLALDDAWSRTGTGDGIALLERSLAQLCGGRESSDLLMSALSDTTPLEGLRYIKAEAKRLLERAPRGPQRDAAKVLYHLSIAQALVRFGVAISRIPPAKRCPLYRAFAEAFGDHPVGQVFARAAKGRQG
ncbi:MAG: hypothetical protein A3I61_17295 [Acidobacteria bacterium RIFCSPLOWO2_02_FULL_68_18]|nr:MAG: hypothetical protein A3I61_17295 [Acidobacteria bacterium RIFCSPLOWO2_02_FULL_68_18]OFW50435.1 MAG: hypothetical protein A3G77_11870 [Acidobacteria bacterium RIFCSPLOWO2_12_FULL_68_19]